MNFIQDEIKNSPSQVLNVLKFQNQWEHQNPAIYESTPLNPVPLPGNCHLNNKQQYLI